RLARYNVEHFGHSQAVRGDSLSGAGGGPSGRRAGVVVRVQKPLELHLFSDLHEPARDGTLGRTVEIGSTSEASHVARRQSDPRARDDVDHAGIGIRSVRGAYRTSNDLDAFDILYMKRNQIPADGAIERVVDGNAVDEKNDVVARETAGSTEGDDV